VFASEYFRTQQTCRIVLDQMGLLSMQPRIRPLLNERDYGTTYDPKMDTDAAFDGDGCESGAAGLRLDC
jgi:bisphosphoglycerate-dependent phosphoglycerate mutase